MHIRDSMCGTYLGDMRLDKYPFVKTVECHYYEFNSKGPKGIVKKIVLYDNMNFHANPIFNLGFGDWNAVTGRMDDMIVTNNKDRKKVLSTVAATVLDFLRDRPNGIIYAEGGTPARNRLYQMGIGLIWDEIKEEMDLYGWLNEFWHPFMKGKNFDAFLLANKNLNYNPNDKKIRR